MMNECWKDVIKITLWKLRCFVIMVNPIQGGVLSWQFRVVGKNACATYSGHISVISIWIRGVEKQICKNFENWPTNHNFRSPYKKIQKQVKKKSRKGFFWPFLIRHQKKLCYSLFQTRPKYYESFKTEYSDSTSFINRLTPLIFFFRGPLTEKTLQGPFMVQTDKFFYIGL